MPLTPEQVTVIKATIPVLKEGGVTLTTKFYQNMLEGTPSVRPFFNPSHQASGMQPRALAHSLLLYASHIDDLGKLSDLVERIVSKHVVLQVEPEQYAVVGHYLIETMKEVLGDLATDAVIDAWTVAYTDLADLLIKLEEERYKVGEWRGFRQFNIVSKVHESEDVVSLVFEPKDGNPIHNKAKPGQYIGIKFTDAEVFAKFEGSIRREYSVSAIPSPNQIRITVKRVPGGVASNYVHDNLAVGSIVDITPPAGAFLYQPTEAASANNVLLLAGGIGITPILPIAKQIIAETPSVKVTLVNSTHTPELQPFSSELASLICASPNFHLINYYSKSTAPSLIENSETRYGHLDKEAIATLIGDAKETTQVYYLGPMGYMVSVAKDLAAIGVPEQNTHREFFFPDQSLTIELS